MSGGFHDVTDAQRAIVAQALDKALAEQVGNLFSVLLSSGDGGALDRFWTGLNRATACHSELLQTINAEEENSD